MDISSLKTASDYEDDGIYVLSEDEMDSQTVLDLQLELSIIKKRLRSTELAYRALEDEYVSIKTSNSMCIACIADLDFTPHQYPNTFLGGSLAGQDCIRLLRQHLDEQGEDYTSSSTRMLVAWMPSEFYSRDFKEGFAACKDALLVETGGVQTIQALLSTLLPLPQLKKVYTTLAPGMTSSLLLPHIEQALDSVHENSVNNNGSHNNHHHNANNTSPFMRHRRSFTSASSLSTMSRSSGNGDSLLSKFVLLQPGQNDSRSSQAIRDLKEDICRSYADNDTVLKDLAETDFETLFPRLDLPHLWTVQPLIEKVMEVIEEAPAQKVKQADIQPTQEAHSEVIEENVVQSPPKENKWAEIVRKGRSKEVSGTSGAAVPSTPTKTTTSTTTASAKIAPSSTSPSASLTPSAAPSKEVSVSPSRTRRSRGGGGRKKEESIPEGSATGINLDPTVSLCRQKKPPCNQYYLTSKGCTNPKCNYSHGYNLSPKQLDEMRQGAAKTACVYRKNGQPCASGDECVFGHKCPQGSRCKQNKCHFPASMH